MNSIPKILDFYLKVVIFIFALTMGAMIMLVGTKEALAMNLKNISIINDDVMTAGDLFDGLQAEKASYVLGPAPQPGKDMVLNARTLIRIAVALDLPWRPQHTEEKVTIRRAATVVDTKNILKALSNKLTETEDVTGRFDIVFFGDMPQLVLPSNMPDTMDIKTLSFNSQKDTFKAVIVSPSLDNPLREETITGRIRHLVSIPVLRNTLQHGDIIGTTDIDLIDVYEDELQYDLILNGKDLVGLTPRRLISSRKVIRSIELERPRIVSRGEFVTLIYKEGPITLSTQGKSLQNGAKGDLVRIVNIASKRSLEGIVTAEREITVTQ